MEELRPLLITYAYNLLGVLEEAEDVVQDVFLKFIQIETQNIQDKKAYLVRMVINHSINQKKKLNKKIIAYPGDWLPEPVATNKTDDGINRKEILSYSLMVLLERLDPKERAVFILKEAYDYDHKEIAAVLAISHDNSRQLLSRAKKQLKVDTSVPEKNKYDNDLNKFLEIIQKADMQKLEQMLYEGIAITSDGGGKVLAAIKVVSGRKLGMLMLTNLYKKFHKWQMMIGEVNHSPALLYYEKEKLVNCQVFTFANSVLINVYFIRNPDKLKFLQKNLSLLSQ